MPEENQLEALIDSIKSELSLAKEELSEVKDTIKYVEQQLDFLTQTIKNLFTPKDTHVCNCQEKSCEVPISTSGESTKVEDQQTQDLAEIVRDFLKIWELKEPYTQPKRFRFML